MTPCQPVSRSSAPARSGLNSAISTRPSARRSRLSNLKSRCCPGSTRRSRRNYAMHSTRAVTVDVAGTEKTVEAEAVLVAVGRAPLSSELGLEAAGVELERGGFVKVDDSFRTTCPSIYAIGDVIRPPLLAHKASAEGIAAVEIMAGVREPGFDLLSIAGCIYCEPEVATVGLSEAEARSRGIDVKIGKIPFRAIGKAVAIGHPDGFVKLVVSKEYSEVIGCQIIGNHATDLISEVVLGKTLETTTAELGRTVHPHPTMSEAIMEAALAAEGEAINY